jgi:hypothetical protein
MGLFKANKQVKAVWPHKLINLADPSEGSTKTGVTTPNGV